MAFLFFSVYWLTMGFALFACLKKADRKPDGADLAICLILGGMLIPAAFIASFFLPTSSGTGDGSN